MNIRKKMRSQPEVHTSALNDILFILLLFFLIVSTLANPNVIKVHNPKAKSDAQAKQTLVITIDKDQKIFVGQKSSSLENLGGELKTFIEKEQTVKPSIVVNGDSISHLGTIVKVMQIIKSSGAVPVIAVNKE